MATQQNQETRLGFLLWNAETGRLTGDPCLAELCGLEAEALRLGVTWPIFLSCLDEICEICRPPEDFDLVNWLAGAGMTGAIFRQKDGPGRSVHISVQRHDTGCTGTVIDIEHDARPALRTGQTFINSMPASAHDCVKVLDLSGVITFVNHGAVPVLDLCSPSDMLGVYWPDMWQERGHERAPDAIEAARPPWPY